MNLVFKQFILLFSICFILTSCESEYSQTVKKELKSGVVYDDLIFGMKLGQTQREFYDRCWQLNKNKLISHGPDNQFAKYIMESDSTSKDSDRIEMLFYGIFDEEKVMHGMHMKMSYLKWAPWNEDYNAEKLMAFLQKKYSKEYGGNPFLAIKIDDDKKAFAKVDGNRQILIYPLSSKDVTVKIQDLRQSKSLNK